MKEEKNSYKGWLNSENFLKRVFAVFFYNMLGNIVLSVITIIILITLFGTLAGIFGKLNISFNENKTDLSQQTEIKREIIPFIHPSWDLDHDGRNDCMKEGTCDHTINYRLHRNTDILNASYSFKINDKEMEIIQLINGKSISSGDDKETYTILKDTIIKDDLGTIAILRHDTSGTGVFYYVVAFLGGKGSEAIYIGDRVKINKLYITDNIKVEYMDRKETDSMADEPTVKKISTIFTMEYHLTDITDIDDNK